MKSFCLALLISVSVALPGCGVLGLFGAKTSGERAAAQPIPAPRTVSLSREAGVLGRLQSLYWPLAAKASRHCEGRGIPAVGVAPVSVFSFPPHLQVEANRVLGVDERARFTDIVPNSPAAKAGIQPGDILLSVGTQPIRADDKLGEIWSDVIRQAERPNAGIRLGLEREGSRYDTIVRPEKHCSEGITVTPAPILVNLLPKSLKQLQFPTSLVEQLEDAPLRAAIAWQVAKQALEQSSGSASVAQIDALAVQLLAATKEPLDGFWSVRSVDSGSRRSLLALAPELGLPSQAIDPTVRQSLVSEVVSTANLPATPNVNEAGLAAYQRYMNRPTPKAFVISREGRWAAAWGRGDALSHAIGICQGEGGSGCTAFAIDDQITR